MSTAVSAPDNLPNVADKSGWPWNEQSAVPDHGAKQLPMISIITPSFNQGRYLEETDVAVAISYKI